MTNDEPSAIFVIRHSDFVVPLRISFPRSAWERTALPLCGRSDAERRDIVFPRRAWEQGKGKMTKEITWQT